MLHPSRPPANGRINAHDRTWEDWLKRTGELPPDFDAMPSIPGPARSARCCGRMARSIPVTTPALVDAAAARAAGAGRAVDLRTDAAGAGQPARHGHGHPARRAERRFAQVRLEFGPGTARDAAHRAGDPGRQGPVPCLPHQSRAQPPVDLHGGAARLHRRDLSRHRSELRQRRRLGRVDRDLSRVRLVVPGAMGMGGIADRRLSADAARSQQGADRARRPLAQRQAGAAGGGVRRAHRRGHAVERQQRRDAIRGATPPNRSPTRASSCWPACSRTGSTAGCGSSPAAKTSCRSISTR